MTIKIKKTDETISVISPFDQNFIRRANQIGGKWEKPYWVFPIENEELVRSALVDIYRHDGSPQPMVTMLLHMRNIEKYIGHDNELVIGSIEVLRKWDRDRAPKVHSDAIVVSGELFDGGGSRNNPRITHSDDCVIRLKNVPLSVAESLVAEDDHDCYEIVNDNPGNAESFTEEEKSVISILKNMEPERIQIVLNQLLN